MGDRALIQLEESDGSVSPVLYLHWAGAEAPQYIQWCAERMRGRDDDAPYAFARLVEIAGADTPGNLSVGVFNMPDRLRPNDSHGDAGCYVVNCRTWEVEAFGGYGRSFLARDGQG